MADSEKLISEGGGSSLPQPRSVTANSDVLKALRHLNDRSGDSVIVESGKTSTGWWRKWSDGFKETGFTLTRTGNGKETATLPIKFSSTNYSISTVPIDATSYFGYGDGIMVVGSRGTTSFTHYAKSGNRRYAIYCAGY